MGGLLGGKLEAVAAVDGRLPQALLPPELHGGVAVPKDDQEECQEVGASCLVGQVDLPAP